MNNQQTYILSIDYNEVYDTYAGTATENTVLGTRSSIAGHILKATDTQVIFELLDNSVIVIPTNWVLFLAPVLNETSAPIENNEIIEEKENDEE